MSYQIISHLNGDIVEEVLEHPTTFKVFLYLKSQEKSVGVRETQRAIGVKSHTTALWHLNKLEEAGILSKSPSNQYQLTEEGKKLRELIIPLNTDVFVYRGMIFPKSPLITSFLATVLIVNLLLLVINIMGRLDTFIPIYVYSLLCFITLIILLYYQIRELKSNFNKINH